jgi:hypothetical protein
MSGWTHLPWHGSAMGCSILGEAAEVVGAPQLRVYGPHQVISETQAAELADLVKHVAGRLGELDPSKNHYQGVWGEPHRRYAVQGLHWAG